MQIFYVRPGRQGGYGTGDGRSFENAWNGFKSVDWDAVSAAEPATVWVCGNPERQSGFMTVHVELSYLQQESDLEPLGAGAPARREAPQPA